MPHSPNEMNREAPSQVQRRDFLKGMFAGAAVLAITNTTHESLLQAGGEQPKKAPVTPPLPETWNVKNTPNGKVTLSQRTAVLENGGSMEMKEGIPDRTYYVSLRWNPAGDAFAVIRTSANQKAVEFSFSVDDKKRAVVGWEETPGKKTIHDAGEVKENDVHIVIVDGKGELHLMVGEKIVLSLKLPQGATGRKIAFRNIEKTSRLHSIVVGVASE